MKAVTYCRFSTDRQNGDADAGSIAQQQAICAECAKRNDLSIVDEYRDEGISGAAIQNRPGLVALLAAAERGEFEVLIVADLSRLSRSQAGLPWIIERLVFRGVRVLGAQDGFDSSREDSDLSAGLHEIMGQQYRRTIANRTRSALKLRAESGRPAGGKSYGYDCVGPADSRQLVIDTEEADVVRQIFLRYAAGESSRTIAADLNAKCIPAPGAAWKRTSRRKDGKWLSSGVYALLQNELYRGQRIWNRSQWRKDPDTGIRRRVERPRSEWIIRTEPTLCLRISGPKCRPEFMRGL